MHKSLYAGERRADCFTYDILRTIFRYAETKAHHDLLSCQSLRVLQRNSGQSSTGPKYQHQHARLPLPASGMQAGGYHPIYAGKSQNNTRSRVISEKGENSMIGCCFLSHTPYARSSSASASICPSVSAFIADLMVTVFSQIVRFFIPSRIAFIVLAARGPQDPFSTRAIFLF